MRRPTRDSIDGLRPFRRNLSLDLVAADRGRRDGRARWVAAADDLPPWRSRTARSGGPRRGALPREPARRVRRASRTADDAAAGDRPRTRCGGAAASPAGRRPGRRDPRRNGLLAEPVVHRAVPASAVGRELSGPDARAARRVPRDGSRCRGRVRRARRRDPGGPDRRAGGGRARRIGRSGVRDGVRLLPDADECRAGPVFGARFDPRDA